MIKPQMLRSSEIRWIGLLALVVLTSCLGSHRPARAGPPKRAVLSGTVRDSLTPVQGATVRLHSGASLLEEAFTDRNGRFSFDSQPGGSHEVSVTSRTHADCRFPVGSWRDGTVLVLEVTPSASAKIRNQRPFVRPICACRMLDRVERRPTIPATPLDTPTSGTGTLAVDVEDAEERTPLPGAHVAVFPAGERAKQLTAYTGDAARAVFANVAPGTYQMLTRRIGYLPNRIDVVVTAGKINVVPVRLDWDRTGIGNCQPIVTSQ